MTANTDQLLETIEHICAAPIEVGGWQIALRSMADLLDADGGTYSGAGVTHGPYQPSFMFHTGIEQTAIQQYADYYHSICERGRYSRRERVGSVYFDYKYFSEADIARSEYYDFLGRYGGKYGLGTTLARPDKTLSSFGTQQCALHFSNARGHPDQDKVATFQRLVPYLIRANSLSQKISEQISYSQSLETALNALPSAAIGLGAGLSIEFANQKADEMFSIADGIRVVSGKLCATSPKAQAKIVDTVRQLSGAPPASGSAPLYLTLERPSGKRPYLLCLALVYLTEQHEGSVLFDKIKFLCTVSDMQAHGRSLREQLQTLFELTETECELAEAMSNGTSLKEFSRRKGGSVKTARWHLHRIFSKTCTSSQTELVSLVNRIRH